MIKLQSVFIQDNNEGEDGKDQFYETVVDRREVFRRGPDHPDWWRKRQSRDGQHRI